MNGRVVKLSGISHHPSRQPGAAFVDWVAAPIPLRPASRNPRRREAPADPPRRPTPAAPVVGRAVVGGGGFAPAHCPGLARGGGEAPPSGGARGRAGAARPGGPTAGGVRRGGGVGPRAWRDQVARGDGAAAAAGPPRARRGGGRSTLGAATGVAAVVAAVTRPRRRVAWRAHLQASASSAGLAPWNAWLLSGRVGGVAAVAAAVLVVLVVLVAVAAAETAAAALVVAVVVLQLAAGLPEVLLPLRMVMAAAMAAAARTGGPLTPPMAQRRGPFPSPWRALRRRPVAAPATARGFCMVAPHPCLPCLPRRVGG